MGAFLIIVIKLSSIKYGEVGNLRKFEYLYNYLGHSRTQVNTFKLAIIYISNQKQRSYIFTTVRPFSILYICYCFWSVKD